MSIKHSTYHFRTNNPNREEFDNYPTPSEAVKPLLKHTTFEGEIFEPCIGEGFLADGLIKFGGLDVSGMDIRGTGRGKLGDFLSDEYFDECDNIVTNPPYKLSLDFLEKSLSITRKKVAFFCYLTFLESESRRPFLTNGLLSHVVVVSNRTPKMKNGKWGSGERLPHAWYVWDKNHDGSPPKLFIENQEYTECQ